MKLLRWVFLFVIACNIVVDISHKIILQNVAFKIFDGSLQVVYISVINALILLPFVLLFSISGYISDKYDKKNVLIYGALSSFSLSILMVIAYALSSFYLAMFGLLCLAIQSAIYSPAKYGMIIHLYQKEKLSLGNAWLQGVTMIVILASMGIFSFYFETLYVQNNLHELASKEALLHAFLPLTYGIALVGFIEFVVSFSLLRRLQSNDTPVNEMQFDWNAFRKFKLLFNNLTYVKRNHVIFLAIIGLSLFWGISQGLIAVFPAYAKEYLHITDVFIINGILASSGIGIALGSYLFSKVSHNYIETGTLPIASLGLACMILASTLVQTPTALMLTFLLFGLFGGLFVVPLNALVQFNAKEEQLGRVLAGNNWFQSLFMLLILCMTTAVSLMQLNVLHTLYLILAITIVGALFTVIKLPQSMVYFFIKFVVGMRYKLEVFGLNNIPSNGGVLLLGNHVSWLDWAIIIMSMPRDVQFVMDKGLYNKWYLKWLLQFFKIIPIANSASKQSIQTIVKALDNGSVVVLFPEGGITHNGHLGEFKRGFELILKQTQTDIPVIAFYIRGLWESMFSRANKKYIDAYRTNTVSISFCKPFSKEVATAQFVKHKVMNLTIDAWKKHIQNLQSIPSEILKRLKEVGNRTIVTDTTGVELSGYKFLTAAQVFKRKLFAASQGENIALMLPTTAAGAFVNTAVLMMGKTVVNLNYTADAQTLVECAKIANIKTLITSKKFIKKLKDKAMDMQPLLEVLEVVYLEDIKENISKTEGILTFLLMKILPSFVLQKLFIKEVSLEKTALIMFSSGSEGTPKGIELSHMNIVGNTQQFGSIVNMHDNDTIVGSLPLFHAFGICVTTFYPLLEGVKMVAHPDPTDGYEIGKLVQQHKATMMFGTSTFFRLYVMNKKLEPNMFASLRLVVAGAEKLSSKVREDFHKRFNINILEGYGATETSPVVSCNLPDTILEDNSSQIAGKIGSVGMPIPGTSIKIVDPDSFEVLKTNEEGMVLIGGVQVMKGYLKNEDKTKSVTRIIDNKLWYITGDKGRLDEDGFLYIVDRYSRFAKLGGEMISMGAIEAKLSRLIEDETIDYVVTSIKDEKKGEKIVLLLSGVDEAFIESLKKEIIQHFENKLMIPSMYKIVESIPKVGSGKTDFNKAKALASKEF